MKSDIALLRKPAWRASSRGHEGEDLGSDGGSLLQAAAELLVEEETGELGGAGALEELDEDAALLTGDAVGGLLEGVVADEVLLVEVLLELAEDRDELRLVEVGVDLLVEELLHLVEVGGVEAGVRRFSEAASLMPSRVSLMPVSSSTLVEARTWTDARFAALRAAGAERRAEDLPERMESFAETRAPRRRRT